MGDQTQVRNLGEEEAEAKKLPKKQGDWITFPFILASTFGLGAAVSGASANLIVYLIKEYNVKSIDAVEIRNIVNGCISFAPVVGAIVSDAFFGCFLVIVASAKNFGGWVPNCRWALRFLPERLTYPTADGAVGYPTAKIFSSAVVSLLATILLTFTAVIQSLRPPLCAFGSDKCEPASAGQLGVLYAALALVVVGTGGPRFTMLAMGANQFDRVWDQSVFFNWFFIVNYASGIFSTTVLFFVEDSVSWTLGFALCSAASAANTAVFLLGTKYYHRPKARGSPFTSLVQVIVAAAAKRNVVVSHIRPNYFYGPSAGQKSRNNGPSQTLRFLNRSAWICDGDTNPDDNSIAKPWRLCTVQQVEDLKTIARIVPIFSSSIFLSVSIGIQLSLTVLEALTMDRSIGPHFSIPAATIGLISSLSASILAISMLDRLLLPLWRSLTHHNPTPLQRIGLDHVLNATAMVASVLVEARRAAIVRSHDMADRPSWVVPMKVVWLVLPMALTGVGEALHFSGQVGLYYQEFLHSLRSTTTGSIAVNIGLGFYLSTAVVNLVQRTTEWLSDNINASRMDKVYWLVAGLAVLNFGYYLLCVGLYKYQNPPTDDVANVADEQGPHEPN